MATEKIVRCSVRVKDNPESAGTDRYIPLDIFEPWKYMMEGRHGFIVDRKMASLWFEKGAASEASYLDIDHELVTQVELFYFSQDDGMLHQQVRYFPSGDLKAYEGIRDIFVSHYQHVGTDGSCMPRLNECRGVWVKR